MTWEEVRGGAQKYRHTHTRNNVFVCVVVVNLNGGGGGGGASSGGGNGGSGIVIFSHSTAYRPATTTGSPTFTTSGGNYIYTFNSSGTITF